MPRSLMPAAFSPTALDQQISTAVEHLHAGQLIAYPTEAVFGLGCDPFNASAVTQLRQLKSRAKDKGLIVIASDWQHIEPLIEVLPEAIQQRMQDSWPGPTTWVCPASPKAPTWLTADNHTIALRITDHPTARQLCDQFHGPIVSTSANPEGHSPAKTTKEVLSYFPSGVFIVDAKVGKQDKPSRIIDAKTGARLR